MLVTKEHLDHGLNYMNQARKRILVTLEAIDLEATQSEIKKNGECASPSCLGAIVKEMSQLDMTSHVEFLVKVMPRLPTPEELETTRERYRKSFESDHEIVMMLVGAPTDSSEKDCEAIREKIIRECKKDIQENAVDNFLELAILFITTLRAAIGFKSPYMPRSWTKKFTEKETTGKENLDTYIDEVTRNIQGYADGQWIVRLLDYAYPVMGAWGVEKLLSLIDMFVRAAELKELPGEISEREFKDPKKIQNEVQEWESRMSPDVINSLEDLDIEL